MNRATRRAAAKKTAIESAMTIADDIATGQLDPDELDAAALTACRELAGTVIGPDDPVWPLQVQIFRDVLAVGGAISADELSEWVAVYRSREGGQAGEGEVPAESVSSPGVEVGPENAGVATAATSNEAELAKLEQIRQELHAQIDAQPDDPVEEEPAVKPSSSSVAARGRGVPRDESVPPPGYPDLSRYLSP